MQHRQDGYVNQLTALGTSNDKRTSTKVEPCFVSDDHAIALWTSDDIAARMVEAWPDEVLRAGFKFVGGGDGAVNAEMARHWRKIAAKGRFARALHTANAVGGSALFMGVVDGRTVDKPIDLDRVTDLTHLTLFQARELHPQTWYDNPLEAKFGEVKTWRLRPRTARAGATEVIVHESRLLIFQGLRTTEERRWYKREGWSHSIFIRVWDVLRDFGVSWASLAVLLSDFSQSVIGIRGLDQVVTSEDEKALQKRLRQMEIGRSVLNAVVLDAEETFERRATPVDGLKDLLELFFVRLAAAARMPLTVLVGVSPGGLNATGESDLQIHYSRVGEFYELRVEPNLRKLSEVLIAAHSIQVPDDEWEIELNPLHQPTELDVAQARKVDAETDRLRIEDGVLVAEEVRQSRYGGAEYGTAVELDDTVFKAEIQAEQDRARLAQEAMLRSMQPGEGDDDEESGDDDATPTDPDATDDPLGG